MLRLLRRVWYGILLICSNNCPFGCLTQVLVCSFSGSMFPSSSNSGSALLLGVTEPILRNAQSIVGLLNKYAFNKVQKAGLQHSAVSRFFFLTPGFFTLHFLGLPLCAQLTYVLLKSAAADRDLYEALQEHSQNVLLCLHNGTGNSVMIMHYYSVLQYNFSFSLSSYDW